MLKVESFSGLYLKFSNVHLKDGWPHFYCHHHKCKLNVMLLLLFDFNCSWRLLFVSFTGIWKAQIDIYLLMASTFSPNGPLSSTDMLITGILLLVIWFFQVDFKWGISACELFYCYFFFCPCQEYQLNIQIYGAIFQINKRDDDSFETTTC